MHAAYETRTDLWFIPVSLKSFLIFAFFDLEFLLSAWVECLCLPIYVCLVISVIIRDIRL